MKDQPCWGRQQEVVESRHRLTEILRRGTKVEVHLHSNAVRRGRGRADRLAMRAWLREERIPGQRRRAAASLEQPD